MNATLMLGELSPVLSLFTITVVAVLIIGPLVLGAVLIQERQVGIVVKRFGARALPPGRFVALGGEAGYQADTLAPGLHFGYWRWQYRIIKVTDHVLQPIVGNYFRNSAQDYTVLDFLSARSQRQVEAAEHIRAAIGAYDVQAIDTLIGDINPPGALMETQTDRKIAEEQRKTYEVQEAAQKQRQQLVRQTSLADIQHQVVGADQGVNIAELRANANVKQATGDAEATRLRALGEAEAIRATGQAKAEAYRAGVEALGAQSYTLMQLMQIVGERSVRIVPDVAVSGANGSTGLVDGLLGMMLRERPKTQSPKTS